MNSRTAKTIRINRSLAIVLPKDWTRGMGVTPGQEVEIVYNGIVKVYPRVRPPAKQVEEGGTRA